MASVYTGFLKWRIFHFRTHRVRPWLRAFELIGRDHTDKRLGSDVKPCVWAVVEVCLGIVSACLPTFPALLHWKSVCSSQRPRRISHSKSADSFHYPVLTPDERRSGSKSEVGNVHKGFLRMIDWADVPKAVEKGNDTRLEQQEVFNPTVQ